MKRIVLGLVTCALGFYSVWVLPRYFPGVFLLSVLFLTAGAWAAAVWSHRTLSSAASAGVGVLGGLLGLFWPVMEIIFQHVDGGGAPPYDNVMFLAAVLLSICAIAGGVLVPWHSGLSLLCLIVATVGTVFVGLIAPDSPPSARWEVLLGLPFLVAGTLASWFRARSGDERPNNGSNPTALGAIVKRRG
jgi:hypothetical protein